MKSKLISYELDELMNVFNSLERHPENKNTAITGECLLEKIINNIPSFDIHVVDKNKVIQNYDALLWVYEVLLTKTPYCYSPLFDSICNSEESIPLEIIYDENKLFNYLRYYQEYMNKLIAISRNIHRHGIPCYLIGDESLDFYLKARQ